MRGRWTTSSQRAFRHTQSGCNRLPLVFHLLQLLKRPEWSWFCIMSFALLSKQAGPCLHQTPPPFVGCLSVICLSALQANICSVVSDTTSLLFAQVLTSVPWTLCLLHPHPEVTRSQGHSFVCTAVLCVLFPWMSKLPNPPADFKKHVLAERCASHGQPTSKNQKMKRGGRYHTSFLWASVNAKLLCLIL